MKLDRKGFMLAEVVVVAVVIATVLVTLYTGLNSVSSAYEIRNKYYDVDSLYVAMEVNDVWKTNGFLNTLKEENNNFSCSYNLCNEESNDFGDFYYDDIGDSFLIYYAPYTKENISNLSSFTSLTSVTFNDYIDYLSENFNFEDDYDYVLIIERLKNYDANDCYYYALKLKY